MIERVVGLVKREIKLTEFSAVKKRAKPSHGGGNAL